MKKEKDGAGPERVMCCVIATLYISVCCTIVRVMSGVGQNWRDFVAY